MSFQNEINLPRYAKYFNIPIEIIHWDIQVWENEKGSENEEKLNSEILKYSKNGAIWFIFNCDDIFKDYFNHFKIGDLMVWWYNSNDITRTSFFLINERIYTNLVKKAKFNEWQGIHILDTL